MNSKNMKNISEYINNCKLMSEGHYEDGEWKYNEIETSDNNDRDIDDYLFEYLYYYNYYLLKYQSYNLYIVIFEQISQYVLYHIF